MELEKRTVGSMGTSMTTEDALSSVREVGKESSPGCAASSSGSNAEPEGFKRIGMLMAAPEVAVTAREGGAKSVV